MTIETFVPLTEYYLTIIALFESPDKIELPPLFDPSLYTSTTTRPLLPPQYRDKWIQSQGEHEKQRRKRVTESSSDFVIFVSPGLYPDRFNRGAYRRLNRQMKTEVTQVKTDELVIVFLVLCIWITVIAIFIKKWGKIRAIEPCQTYYSPEIYDIPLKKSMGITPEAGLSPVGPGPSGLEKNGSHHMTSTESKRSLSGPASRRESYPIHCLTKAHAGAASQSISSNASVQAGQRLRLNSVFVTPPTRPPTPLPGESSSRRFKSAEDLRSIVTHFTRRKSTLLMSPSYFQRHSHHYHA